MTSARYRNRWQSFYDAIKDPSWPDCPTERHFVSLPTVIQKEILEIHNGHAYLEVSPDDLEFADLRASPSPMITTENYEFDQSFVIDQHLTVFYNDDIYGFGDTVGQDLPAIIRCLYSDRKFHHALDWCCGAGFFGYRLLHDGICQRLCLMDHNPVAIEACIYTAQHDKNTVDPLPTFVTGSRLNCLPKGQKFDLVVGNPPPARQPLFPSDAQQLFNSIFVDWNLDTHRDFFANIAEYLSEDGVILLVKEGNTIWEMIPWIEAGKLQIKRVFRERAHNSSVWYLELEHHV